MSHRSTFRFWTWICKYLGISPYLHLWLNIKTFSLYLFRSHGQTGVSWYRDLIYRRNKWPIRPLESVLKYYTVVYCSKMINRTFDEEIYPSIQIPVLPNTNCYPSPLLYFSFPYFLIFKVQSQQYLAYRIIMRVK